MSSVVHLELIALQEVVVMTELEEALILTHLEIEFRWLIIFYHQKHFIS
jgi:hypothetical protein